MILAQSLHGVLPAGLWEYVFENLSSRRSLARRAPLISLTGKVVACPHDPSKSDECICIDQLAALRVDALHERL